MAHELTIRSNGNAEMFSLRANPWHGLGTVIQRELNDSEVRQTAGIDWEVEEAPVMQAITKPSPLDATDTITDHQQVAGYKILRRSDTKAPLAVVSQGYRSFTNQELVDLMRRIAGQTPVVWETAGSLKGGQIVWALGRLPDLDLTINGDASQSYMLLHNGHGNGRALQIVPTTVRVVCANTARMALANQEQRATNEKAKDYSRAGLASGYSIRHASTLDQSVADAAAAYHRLIADHAETRLQSQAMADAHYRPEDVAAYWDAIFRLNAPAGADEETRMAAEKRKAKITGKLDAILASGTCQIPGTAGSYYALAQAAIEYLDHEQGNGKTTAASRFYRSNFHNSGTQTKDRAWTTALELATA